MRQERIPMHDEEEHVGFLSGRERGGGGGQSATIGTSGTEQPQTCYSRWSILRYALLVAFVLVMLILFALRLSDVKVAPSKEVEDGEELVVPNGGAQISVGDDEFNLHDQYTKQPTLSPSNLPTEEATQAPSSSPTGTASPTWPFPPLIEEPHTRDESRPAERRCGGLLLHPVNKQLKFQTSGEIQPVHSGAPDLFFLASGAERDPNNRSFFDAVGQDVMTNIWKYPRETYVPINERKPAGVLYRSSNCQPRKGQRGKDN